MSTVMNTIAVSGGRLWRLQKQARQQRLPWLPIIVLLIVLICAIFAPWLAPEDPTSLNILDKNIAPAQSWDHLLGTDVLGRDLLSRMIFGARTTVKISLISLAIGAVAGTAVGLVSGYKGGWVDVVMMRITDAALGFPTILVALIVVVV